MLDLTHAHTNYCFCVACNVNSSGNLDGQCIYSNENYSDNPGINLLTVITIIVMYHTFLVKIIVHLACLGSENCYLEFP